ncbi:MAG: CHASE2 domain-containing protein [Phormidesmis sp.]
MLGQTLAKRYKLTRILGAGGFGQTYLAIDLKQPHQPACVVKQLKPASQDANFLMVARRLFETEVKTLGNLGSHSQIPSLLDSFEEDNEFYLVQEYIDGQSLEAEIKQAGRFEEDEAIALLEGVLPVLDFIHQNHVVHRDLKPDNLIRRRKTGEMVLIDFGAVKEIRTRLITGEQTALTIGIGTQGYTPSEQLSGKPCYSSDIYALGMTAIHALTGKAPTDLPEVLGSLDPCWQDCAQVSPGLAILLGKMTRHYLYQRYQTVEDVLHDLGRLEALPAELAAANTFLETSMPERALVSAPVARWRMGKRAKQITIAISTLATSAFILGLRQVGAFVPAELGLHDRFVSAQADPGPDPRLLIVEITEADLRSLSLATPSDESVATVIENLQQHQPALIGLDLLRDLPQAPGTEALRESLRSPNVVAVTQLSNAEEPDLIPPPPGITFDQVSFNNIVVDSDFRVRRAMMLDFLDNELLAEARGRNLVSDVDNSFSDPIEQPVFSLGVELAIRYLALFHAIGPEDGDVLQLGDTQFNTISPTFGGYQQADTAGHQIFMRYRSSRNVATRLDFLDVLNNKFDSAIIQDKIILIGSTAGSSRDLFLTPFNTGGDRQEMPGVVLHAQVTTQILSAVLEGETLPWAWPDWLEITWIVILTGTGSVLMVLTQKGPVLIAFGISGLAVTFLVGLIGFSLGGWVPIAAPMSAFFASAAGTRISKSYQRRHWEAHQ